MYQEPEMARKSSKEPSRPPMSAHAPLSAIKLEFSRRLRAQMDAKGWNQSETARRLTPKLKRHSLSRDNISKYLAGKNLPGPIILKAMAELFGCEPTDLLPSRGSSKAAANAPMDVRDLGDGTAWVRVNQALSWEMALQMMKLLRGEER